MMQDRMKKIVAMRPIARLAGLSLRDLLVTVVPLVALTLCVIIAAFWLVRPAPPDTITIAGGPDNSTFSSTAEKYRKILARNGVKLKILKSEGSLANLKMLSHPATKVDVGFVQGGVAAGVTIDKLVSLGSVFHVPLFLFYQTSEPITLLSELKGKRLAIGPEGSGTHALALIILKANGIEPGGETVLMNIGGEEAAQALTADRVDAAFLMGDSAAPPIMRALMRTHGIEMYNFVQADAYVRRYHYLSKLDLPMGAFDFGQNLPAQDIHLVGPTVELVARDNLHPALSDLLIEAAREVHGRATLLQKSGEFPAPLEHEYRISDDARRYYSSGKSFLYRKLPFWLASLADRLLVVIIPIIVLLIPGLKLVPVIYNWRVTSRIYRWYGKLIEIERSMIDLSHDNERQELHERLDSIEAGVNRMKIPIAYANQVYILREHIRFVRERLTKNEGAII